MRLGRERPRKLAGGAVDIVAGEPGFNEAGARTPQKGKLDASFPFIKDRLQ